MIYLAHAIDKAGNHAGIENAASVVRVWARENGHLVYCPAQAWAGSFNVQEADAVENINEINEHALQQASHVVAILHNEVPSFGVPYELATASYLTKEVRLVDLSSDRAKDPFSMAYCTSTWPTYRGNSTDGLYDWLTKEVGARG